MPSVGGWPDPRPRTTIGRLRRPAATAQTQSAILEEARRELCDRLPDLDAYLEQLAPLRAIDLVGGEGDEGCVPGDVRQHVDRVHQLGASDPTSMCTRCPDVNRVQDGVDVVELCPVSKSLASGASPSARYKAGIVAGHAGWARGDLNPHILSDTGT
jgi:hypothetical protein